MALKVEKYRGYVLTPLEGGIDIAYQGEHIDWTVDVTKAKALVDYWLTAY